MLGKKNVHSALCKEQGFIGADFGFKDSLSEFLPNDRRDFNQHYAPKYLSTNPDKSKTTAGLACGALWTVSKGLRPGDIVLAPDGEGSYFVGEIAGEYYFEKNQPLPHRRRVKWFHSNIPRENFSQELKNSSGSIGTTCNISGYAKEIEELINGEGPAMIIATNSQIEDPAYFAMESHLEAFLVQNWNKSDFGRNYDIYQDEEEGFSGQQFETDTGRIDILAISKNKKELLVIELKRGRASDVVVGQIQRYMGYVVEELAEAGQIVRGAIVGLEDDQKIKRALVVTNNIDFYRYEIQFTLKKITTSSDIQQKR